MRNPEKIIQNLIRLKGKTFKFFGDGPFKQLDLMSLLPDKNCIVHKISYEPVDYVVLGDKFDPIEYKKMSIPPDNELSQVDFINLILFGKHRDLNPPSDPTPGPPGPPSDPPPGLPSLGHPKMLLPNGFESIGQAEIEAKRTGKRTLTVLGYSTTLKKRERNKILRQIINVEGTNGKILCLDTLNEFLQIRLRRPDFYEKSIRSLREDINFLKELSK